MTVDLDALERELREGFEGGTFPCPTDLFRAVVYLNRWLSERNAGKKPVIE